MGVKRRNVAMIFVDGVGIGPKQPSINPFYAAEYPALSEAFGGFVPSSRDREKHGKEFAVVPLDATLGIPGLPQSGTGQTALFTGTNAARHVGKHFGPYPYSTLHPIIKTDNIFNRLRLNRKYVSFVNAYPKQFFEYVNSGKRRLTVTTLSYMLNGMPLLGSGELHSGKAISADITNGRWDALGYPDMPVIAPEEAGKRFADITRSNDFTLFEYFLPDHAGHKQSMSFAVEVIQKLDGFLSGMFNHLDNGTTLFIMTSDHGNVEDLRTKTHTRNPVPLWVYGKESDAFVDGLTSLVDITPRILNWLK